MIKDIFFFVFKNFNIRIILFCFIYRNIMIIYIDSIVMIIKKKIRLQDIFCLC